MTEENISRFLQLLSVLPPSSNPQLVDSHHTTVKKLGR
jgi:hypothetical protein